MVNFQNGDDAKRDFKAILCLTALHLCAMPSRIFFVVFQLWQLEGIPTVLSKCSSEPPLQLWPD